MVSRGKFNYTTHIGYRLYTSHRIADSCTRVYMTEYNVVGIALY